MRGGGNLIDPQKTSLQGVQYRVRLLKLQRDPGITRNIRRLLTHVLCPAPKPGEKEDRRKSRLSDAVVDGFKWLFLTAFKVTERGGWAHKADRFDGEWRRTAWPEIQEEAGLSRDDVKLMLKRLENAGFLSRERDRDLATQHVTELRLTIHPEVIGKWRRPLGKDRKEAKKDKKKRGPRDPLADMAVPFSHPTPTAWAELHLGRVLAHHSNFRECLPAAIRYHKGGVAFRRLAEDKRKAKVPSGWIKYALGLTKIFAPDITGRRILKPERFDGQGRRLITATEIEKQTGCTVAECRRAAEFYKKHGILVIEHGQKLTREGFWARWSFEAFGRFLEGFPSSRFDWYQEPPRLVLIEKPPPPKSARTAQQVRSEMEAEEGSEPGELNFDIIPPILNYIKTGSCCCGAAPAGSSSASYQKEEKGAVPAPSSFFELISRTGTAAKHPLVVPGAAGAPAPESVQPYPLHHPGSPRPATPSIVPARFSLSDYPEITFPRDFAQWVLQARDRQWEREARESILTPIPRVLEALEDGLRRSGKPLISNQPFSRLRDFFGDWRKKQFNSITPGQPGAKLPPTLVVFAAWLEQEEAAWKVRAEASQRLGSRPGFPPIDEHFGPAQGPRYMIDRLLPLAGFLAKQGPWARFLIQDVPLTPRSREPVKVATDGPFAVVEVPETVAYLLARLAGELEIQNPVSLPVINQVWKLAKERGLSPELIEYYLGQGKDLFLDEQSWMGNCPLEFFLSAWPRIRKILERELEKNRSFQQRNRGVNLPCLEEFPEWFRGKMDSFRADPVLDPARPETILLHVAWLLEQPGRREEAKTKWRATVFKMIFEQPYLYHYLRSRLDLDWLCNLDGPKRSHLEKGYWRQYEEAAQQQALQQQQAREERGEEGPGADTSTGDQADAEHTPKRRNDEPASPLDRGLDLDAIFELCATPGQVALIGGITGRGKTVFASQLALRLARQGRRVAMVLTETEGPDRIFWRFLSSTFNLTLGEIRERSWKTDGAFPEEWRSRPGWAELDRALKNCLRFLDWTTGGQDISQDLDPALGKLAASGFDPQIVIIDGLINGVKSPEPLRFTMLRAAEVIKTHAQVRQRAMIVTSQIDTVGAKNHTEVLPAMLSECPGIVDHADTWVGISDIENADPALGMVPSLQSLTVQGKSRRNEVVQVVRNFAFQRFEPVTLDWVRILNKWG